MHGLLDSALCYDVMGQRCSTHASPVPPHPRTQASRDLSEDGAWRLYFEAEVPALGWSTYYLSVCVLTHWTGPTELRPECAATATELDAAALQQRGGLQDGQSLSLSFDAQACVLGAAVVGGRCVPLAHRFETYYSPMDSVYQFNGEAPPTPKALSNCRLRALVGPLVEEAWAETDSGVSWVVRLLRAGPPAIRFAATVGRLENFEDLVMSLEPVDPEGLADARVTYHENGVERQPLNPDAKLSPGEAYHPLVSRLTVRGAALAMHVVTHAPHGATSRRPAHVEVMLHRRAAYQPLRGDDVSTVTLSPFHLLLGDPTTTEQAATRLAAALQAPLVPLTPPLAWPMPKQPQASLKPSFSGLSAPLPPELHLLALTDPAYEVGGGHAVLLCMCASHIRHLHYLTPHKNVPQAPGEAGTRVTLQLQHIVDREAGAAGAVNVTLDVATLLGAGGRRVVGLQERTLTSLYGVERLGQRVTWGVDGEGGAPPQVRTAQGCGAVLSLDRSRVSVSVAPMDFCTLELRLGGDSVAQARNLRKSVCTCAGA
jgi:hypothetical protein